MISLSTHVLDTAVGRPASGVLIVLYRGDMFMAEGRTDEDGRAQLAERLDPTTAAAVRIVRIVRFEQYWRRPCSSDITAIGAFRWPPCRNDTTIRATTRTGLSCKQSC